MAPATGWDAPPDEVEPTTLPQPGDPRRPADPGKPGR
jgi:hypothetical protein